MLLVADCEAVLVRVFVPRVGRGALQVLGVEAPTLREAPGPTEAADEPPGWGRLAQH